MLRARLGGRRIVFTDAERRQLAEKARALGRKALHDRWLKVVGAKGNNLKNVTVEFPLGTMTCVTGVSGGGKSTLTIETLFKAASRKLKGTDKTKLTIYKFYRELAQLGGFLGRKHDGEPGWITLWRGWEKLNVYLRGYEIGQQLDRKRSG